MKLCPQCNYRNTDNSQFCTKCGKPLPVVKSIFQDKLAMKVIGGLTGFVILLVVIAAIVDSVKPKKAAALAEIPVKIATPTPSAMPSPAPAISPTVVLPSPTPSATPKIANTAVEEAKSQSTQPEIRSLKSSPVVDDRINNSGASAKCRDGSLSYSQHRRGTCSHHGGVAVWY